MDDYTPNELALLDLLNDINKTFSFVGEPDEPSICDGVINVLNAAVKKFKTRVWENQL